MDPTCHHPDVTEYFLTGQVIWYRPDVDEKKVRLKIIVVVIQNWVVRFGHVDTHRREIWADQPRSGGGIAPQQYPHDDDDDGGDDDDDGDEDDDDDDGRKGSKSSSEKQNG